MKTFTINELLTILENCTSFNELIRLQNYINENKPFYSICFYKEITKIITRKFSTTFLKVKYDPIFN
jgi:hypothetical protein